MRVSTVVMTHAHPDLTADTVDAVETWVGDQVLVLVDEVGWPAFRDARIGSARVESGFRHAHNRSPYRNAALALKRLYELWPESDWFLYTEYDCLFLSSAFRAELYRADAAGAWCAGVDLRRFDFQIPLLEELLGLGPIRHSYYLLGCTVFLSRQFVSRLYQSGFLDRLLDATRGFEKGHFPGYPRWAFEEELWPTAAAHLGGKVYELACWKLADRSWHPPYADDPNAVYCDGDRPNWRGRYPVYQVRFRPEATFDELSPETCVAHPVKDLDSPIRARERVVRELVRRKRAGL